MAYRPNDPAAEHTSVPALAECGLDDVMDTVLDGIDCGVTTHGADGPVASRRESVADTSGRISSDRADGEALGAVDPEPPTPPRPRPAIEPTQALDPAPPAAAPPAEAPPAAAPPVEAQPSPDSALHQEPDAPALPARPDARPRIVEDPVILGLSRVSRSRLGSRLFTWFFVFVYALILVQLIVTLLQT